MELIDTRIYDDPFLLGKIFNTVKLNTKEKESLYKHFEKSKRGKWIIDEYGIRHCPFCKAINNTVYTNYCPNCGARMDGEEDG